MTGEADPEVADWWRTSIIDMAPGRISVRGSPIQGLIGTTGFSEMIWLTVVGERLDPIRASLLEAALVAAVDHGPQAPSIAAARMAITCGVGINNALATGVNMLGDVHGGAGEQTIELYRDVAERAAGGASLEVAAEAVIRSWQSERGHFVPGFGHRYHKEQDPRAPRLLDLARDAARTGAVSGKFVAIGQTVEAVLETVAGKRLAMNIDGATAVIFAELGCPAPLARGLFCLSRSVGILAHAWEQSQQGGRNKGPTPPHFRWTYDGPRT